MGHMKRTLVVIVFLLVGELSAQQVQFFREKIEFRVRTLSCTVTGTYYFKNPTSDSISVPIFFPVALNDSLPYPDLVQITDLASRQKLSFHLLRRGFAFSLRMAPRSVSVIQIFYRQNTPFRHMEYILTTTRHWNRPLAKAEYFIYLPEDCRLVQVNYPFKQFSFAYGLPGYYYSKNQFMPNHNLIFKWRVTP